MDKSPFDNLPLNYGIVFLIYYGVYWLMSLGIQVFLLGIVLVLVSNLGILLLPALMALILDRLRSYPGAGWWGYLLLPCCMVSMVWARLTDDYDDFKTFRMVLFLVCLSFLIIGICLGIVRTREAAERKRKADAEAAERKRKADYEWEHGGREKHEREEREKRERKEREECERRKRKEQEEIKRRECQRIAAKSTFWGTGVYCNYCGSDNVKKGSTYSCDYLGREHESGANCSGCRANGCISTVYVCCICNNSWQTNPDIY